MCFQSWQLIVSVASYFEITDVAFVHASDLRSRLWQIGKIPIIILSIRLN